MHKIPILVIRFKNTITSTELPSFRGAICSRVPTDMVLFHNHLEQGFRYRYPLIQYKRIGGKAAILCVGEGTDTIAAFFANAQFDLHIGSRLEHFEVDSVYATSWILQTWSKEFMYTLRKWLPFNTVNYLQYQQIQSEQEKKQFLERILVGNLLSMCTGLDRHVDTKISCHIQEIIDLHLYTFKGVRMQGIDLIFSTNVYLPDYIGLGKGVSHGFGVVHNNKIDRA